MALDPLKRASGLITRLGSVVAIVASVTACTSLLEVNPITVGFSYLIAILWIAARWGLLESVAASVAAVLCFNFFFLPPVGTFTIADPQNWVALAAFLATAMTASRLSAQVKNRAAEAIQRQEELERLYALSRGILLIQPTREVAKQVTSEVAQVLGAASVTLYDRETQQFYRSGPEDFPGLDEQLKVAASGTCSSLPGRHAAPRCIDRPCPGFGESKI